MQNIEQLYINGQWINATGNESLSLINPATEQIFATVTTASDNDVESAILAARQAFPSWSSSSAAYRAELMNTIADEMQKDYQAFVDAHVEMIGCPISIAGAFHVDCPIEAMRYYAKLAANMEQTEQQGSALLTKEAVGVCAFINPWNYPLHQLIGKLAPALAAGCTIVAKPAEQTPTADLYIARILHRVGVPAGVFNLVFGRGSEIGPQLASNPDIDMISFTGSTRAGVEVAKNAAASVKRVCQELGGKSAYIITEDADLTASVRYGVEDGMGNTGQTCNALTRMLVPASKLQQIIEIATACMNEQVIGDPLLEATTMGPLVSALQQQKVLEYLAIGQAEGATLITQDLPSSCANGFYVAPAIFANVTPDMRIAREEIFGPVLCIISYDDIDQAIEMANDSEYGLSSAVYAKDKASATQIAKRIRAGQCYLQGSYFTIDAPFGGYKRSGNGREWGEQAMAEYIETKAIICD